MKVCLVGSSGGHLTHLYMLKPFWKDKERFWVTFDKEDARSLLEGEKMYPCYYPTNRSLKALIINTKIAWKVLRSEKPDLINCLEHDLEENPSPFYLQENIEYPGTANSYAYMSGKARYKDHDEEKAKLLEEKYSSREKKIDFHVLSVQIVQEIKGIIRLLKVMLEKENGNWDKVKEQNDGDKAGAGFTGRKIKAYDKLELTDEQQKVLDALRQNCVEETLWSAIAAFQNYPFRTASGLPYQYKLKIGKDGTYNKELLIDRRENSKTLSWSSIKMAFQNCRQISGIVKRPKALGDIRGISYIYPLFWKFGLIEVPEESAKKMGGECDTEAEL